MEDLAKETGFPAFKLADLLVKLQVKGLIEEYFKNQSGSKSFDIF